MWFTRTLEEIRKCVSTVDFEQVNSGWVDVSAFKNSAATVAEYRTSTETDFWLKIDVYLYANTFL